MRDLVGGARDEVGGPHADAGEEDLIAVGHGGGVEEGPFQGEVQEEGLAVRPGHVGDGALIEELVREVVRKGDRLVRIGYGQRRVADEVEAGLQPEEG